MTQPTYAIGDIHGQIDHLHQALELIEADGGQDAKIVFLGDYVDRGPDSRGVIELLSTGIAAGRNWTALLGNHDRMFKWFLEDTPRHDPHMKVGYHWLHPKLGGIETLESYGVILNETDRLEQVHEAALAKVPGSHIAFLNSLPTYHLAEPCLFVHAGIRPGKNLGAQHENDLVWIRDPFLTHTEPFPWLVIHGHTALQHATHFGNRVDLDGGTGFGRPLHPAVIEGRDVQLLTPSGRQPVPMSPDCVPA